MAAAQIWATVAVIGPAALQGGEFKEPSRQRHDRLRLGRSSLGAEGPDAALGGDGTSGAAAAKRQVGLRRRAAAGQHRQQAEGGIRLRRRRDGGIWPGRRREDRIRWSSWKAGELGHDDGCFELPNSSSSRRRLGDEEDEAARVEGIPNPDRIWTGDGLAMKTSSAMTG